jgi:hypothetical protein
VIARTEQRNRGQRDAAEDSETAGDLGRTHRLLERERTDDNPHQRFQVEERAGDLG